MWAAQPRAWESYPTFTLKGGPHKRFTQSMNQLPAGPVGSMREGQGGQKARSGPLHHLFSAEYNHRPLGKYMHRPCAFL